MPALAPLLMYLIWWSKYRKCRLIDIWGYKIYWFLIVSVTYLCLMFSSSKVFFSACDWGELCQHPHRSMWHFPATQSPPTALVWCGGSLPGRCCVCAAPSPGTCRGRWCPICSSTEIPRSQTRRSARGRRPLPRPSLKWLYPPRSVIILRLVNFAGVVILDENLFLRLQFRVYCKILNAVKMSEQSSPFSRDSGSSLPPHPHPYPTYQPTKSFQKSPRVGDSGWDISGLLF